MQLYKISYSDKTGYFYCQNMEEETFQDCQLIYQQVNYRTLNGFIDFINTFDESISSIFAR